jgi:hypothetical protein
VVGARFGLLNRIPPTVTPRVTMVRLHPSTIRRKNTAHNERSNRLSKARNCLTDESSNESLRQLLSPFFFIFSALKTPHIAKAPYCVNV